MLVVAILYAFVNNVLGQFTFDVLNVYKSEVDIVAHNSGHIQTMVNTGKFDIGPCSPCFIDIHPGGIKSSEIINHSYHKFFWKICF